MKLFEVKRGYENMEDEEKCDCSESGKCNYYEDSDLECSGSSDEQNHCARYVGYFQQ